MLRLVRLEYLKLKSNRAMWILLGLYFVAIAAIAIGAGSFLDYLTDQGVDYRGVNPSIFPIYDWEDIWHNLAYVAYFFAVLPAFLIIISVSNEFAYKTHRQNIIDGLSRTEFFLSKLSFAGFLALTSGAFLFVLGSLLAAFNADFTWRAFFDTLEFIPAHALQLFLFFLFAILLVLLIRKSGITIVLLLIYAVILEPIGAALLKYFYPESGPLLPLDSIGAIVRVPFSKYILMYTQNFISGMDLLRGIGWGVVFTLLIFWILKRKDF